MTAKMKMNKPALLYFTVLKAVSEQFTLICCVSYSNRLCKSAISMGSFEFAKKTIRTEKNPFM